MTRSRRHAFTLVELLVVIGIIALLIGILLPVLGAAREQARMIKCGANLRTVGQGLAFYESQYKGAVPAAVLFAGFQLRGAKQYGPAGTQSASDIWGQGYISWTAGIYGKELEANDPAYFSTKGWEAFQCPSLEKGGLPPASTYPDNNDGFTNEVNPYNAANPIVDRQAPRLAYTLNEALAPRGRLGDIGTGTAVNTPYHYVKTSAVRDASNTILATEMWGLQALALTKSQFGGAVVVSNSRRPVHGFHATKSNTNGAQLASVSADAFYSGKDLTKAVPVTTADLVPDPSTDATWIGKVASASAIDTTLNYIGRNHGRRGLTTVAGPSGSIGGWDERLSNFLYVDGHVETKNVADTVYPNFQWGDKFYDLVR